ncbi:hypothetical protein D3C75_1055250 [compost metagenome]
MHRAALIEKAVLDIGKGGDHFMAGTLVLGQFGDECKNLCGVSAYCGANGKAHAGLP